MNIHLLSRRLKIAQLLETSFFSIIIGAFIFVIPMKSKRLETKNREAKGSMSFTSQGFLTGERQVGSESLSPEKWSQVFEWSDQLSIETDQGPGEKE